MGFGPSVPYLPALQSFPGETELGPTPGDQSKELVSRELFLTCSERCLVTLPRACPRAVGQQRRAGTAELGRSSRTTVPSPLALGCRDTEPALYPPRVCT